MGYGQEVDIVRVLLVQMAAGLVECQGECVGSGERGGVEVVLE